MQLLCLLAQRGFLQRFDLPQGKYSPMPPETARSDALVMMVIFIPIIIFTVYLLSQLTMRKGWAYKAFVQLTSYFGGSRTDKH